MTKITTKRFLHPLIVEEALRAFSDASKYAPIAKVGKPNKIRQVRIYFVHQALADYVKILKGRNDFTQKNRHQCSDRKVLSFRRVIHFAPMSSTVYQLDSRLAETIEKKAKERKTTPSRIFTGAVMTGLSQQKGINDVFCDLCSESIYGNRYLYSVIGYTIRDGEGNEVRPRKNLYNWSNGLISEPVLQHESDAFFIWLDSSNGDVIHLYGNNKIFQKKALVQRVDNSGLAKTFMRLMSKGESDFTEIENAGYKVVEVLGKGLIKLSDGRYVAVMYKPFSML